MEHSEGGAIRLVYNLKTVVLVVLRLAVFTYGQEIDPCPDGFKLAGDICYKVMEERQEFAAANKTCSDLGVGAILVEPRSPEENTAVADMTSSREYFPWLGGSPSSTEGKWKWNSDRRIMAWTQWRTDYPSPEGHHRCMAMKDGWQWINRACTHASMVVTCQKERAGGKDKTAGEQKARDQKAGDQKAGDQKAGDQKTGEQKTGEADNTVEENTTAGNSTNNSSEKQSAPSFLMSVCLSAVAMMKVF